VKKHNHSETETIKEVEETKNKKAQAMVTKLDRLKQIYESKARRTDQSILSAAHPQQPTSMST